MRQKRSPSARKSGARKLTKPHTRPCIFRIRRIPNPREKDLVLVEFPLRRHHSIRAYLWPCIPLCVHSTTRSVFARLSAHCAYRRVLSRIKYLIPNRLSNADPIILSRVGWFRRNRFNSPSHVKWMGTILRPSYSALLIGAIAVVGAPAGYGHCIWT